MKGQGETSAEKRELLKREILAIGFDRVGVASAGPVADFGRYAAWLDGGFAGTMRYLRKHRAQREDPRELLPEARSVIVLSLNYAGPGRPEPARGRGRISRYALGRDYHKILRKRMKAVEALLRERHGAGATRSCVDSAPLLERSLAAAAGLGWIGKNTMLIDEKLGSWTFLGAVLCDLELPPDSRAAGRCGSCVACLEACPTGAFPEPGLLDARRCISYLTIEHRGEIEPELAAKMGNHVFGCDICQEVCPWNASAPPGGVEDFRPRPGLVDPPLSELADLDEDRFLARFAGTPVMRAGLEGMRRNARIAMENSKRIP